MEFRAQNKENEVVSLIDGGSPKKAKLRPILSDDAVAQKTKDAVNEEEERRRRILERDKLFSLMYNVQLPKPPVADTTSTKSKEKKDKSQKKKDKKDKCEKKREKKKQEAAALPELNVATDGLILDFDQTTKKELIRVDDAIAKVLKPHQVKGVKFMWDNCFETLHKTQTTRGSGCILAHCMGMGKTLQCIALIHTVLVNRETGICKVIVFCPKSTILNWKSEFKKWLKDAKDGDEIDVYEMTQLTNPNSRVTVLENWDSSGGVLLMGYEMFRCMTYGNNNMRMDVKANIASMLVDPGADLIICDEGHKIKNNSSTLTLAFNGIKTARKIILTGTPLQNNLLEYHCMMQFVKPDLLGSKLEFSNRFANPIRKGEAKDAEPEDVILMKRRAHVLYSILEGCVQRYGYDAIKPYLPPKYEYVIKVALRDTQSTLYQEYLARVDPDEIGSSGKLFKDYQNLLRIWTHPGILRLHQEKKEELEYKELRAQRAKKKTQKKENEEALEDDGDSDIFNQEEEISDDQLDEEEGGVGEKKRRRIPWWERYVEPEETHDIHASAKFSILFSIIRECERNGEKLVVFSQSLYVLTLIEEFLKKVDEEAPCEFDGNITNRPIGSWSGALDYFRLDGQTSTEVRQYMCNAFNDTSNLRTRLFLISTRAGGLGINLVGANRAVVFDVSWNPTHDLQSIFRIYRFGQDRPCFVYRLVTFGTMEEKIYNRQVTKLSLSGRVVDSHQIERHYYKNELIELYELIDPPLDRSILPFPREDRVFAEIISKHKDDIVSYHEHDSLLENKTEEELSEAERAQAWKEYEREKTGNKSSRPPMNDEDDIFEYLMQSEYYGDQQDSDSEEHMEECCDHDGYRFASIGELFSGRRSRKRKAPAPRKQKKAAPKRSRRSNYSYQRATSMMPPSSMVSSFLKVSPSSMVPPSSIVPPSYMNMSVYTNSMNVYNSPCPSSTVTLTSMPSTSMPSTSMPSTAVPSTSKMSTPMPLTPMTGIPIPPSSLIRTSMPSTTMTGTPMPLSSVIRTSMTGTPMIRTSIPSTSMPATMPSTPTIRTSIPTSVIRTSKPLTPMIRTPIPSAPMIRISIPSTSMPATMPSTSMIRASIPSTSMPATMPSTPVIRTSIPSTSMPSTSMIRTSILSTSMTSNSIPSTPMPLTSIRWSTPEPTSDVEIEVSSTSYDDGGPSFMNLPSPWSDDEDDTIALHE